MRITLLALLATVLASAGAGAQDACLSGASTLGDQRALTALAASTETACPCDAAATRRAWQRCAKVVFQTSLTGGTLREECSKTAKKTLQGTSCGGATLPCGSVARSGDDAPTCALKKARSCEDSKKLDRTSCASETSCSDVVDWTAGTCLDPRDPGQYASGVRVITWTKDSAASPGTPRPLETVIWYPTAAGSGPVDSLYAGVVDAPIDPSGGPYPVVLFSHGSCGYPLQSTFLTPLLASRGYIVVAPPHPGNTIYEFPNCQANLGTSFVERPQDMIFVLDQILAAGQDPTSPFFGAVDGSRVAMTGHSFGGLTTFLVSALDARIKAAVAMAPAALAASKFIGIPSLIALGNIDGRVNNTNNRQAYANSDAPKLLVEVEHAGHYAFSNGCFASPDCNPPTTLTQDEAHAFVLRYVIPFIDRYLGGNEAAAPLLGPPTAPGLLYQADL